MGERERWDEPASCTCRRCTRDAAQPSSWSWPSCGTRAWSVLRILATPARISFPVPPPRSIRQRTRLLSVVTTLSLSVKGGLSSLVLGDLVGRVLAASLAFAVRPAGLGNVNHLRERGSSQLLDRAAWARGSVMESRGDGWSWCGRGSEGLRCTLESCRRGKESQSLVQSAREVVCRFEQREVGPSSRCAGPACHQGSEGGCPCTQAERTALR